ADWVGLCLAPERVIGGARTVIGKKAAPPARPWGDSVALSADDAQAAVFAYFANRAPMREPFDARDHGAALPLGAGIEFPDSVRPQPLDPFLLQPCRQRCGHMEYNFEVREIVGIAHMFRQRPDPMHHCRNEIDPLNALSLDLAQRLLGMEFNKTSEATAREQREMREDKWRVMIEWARIEHRAVARYSERRVGGGGG